MRLDDYVRNIPEFPRPGVIFKDITPLLKDPNALQYTYRAIANQYSEDEIDVVVGAEGRGFLFGVGVALLLNKGFIPIRKPGKLPYATYKQPYPTHEEPGGLEIHQDAIRSGQRVLLIDDLLATGETAQTAIELVKKCGGIIVGCAFVIELSIQNGRESLSPYPVFSLLRY